MKNTISLFSLHWITHVSDSKSDHNWKCFGVIVAKDGWSGGAVSLPTWDCSSKREAGSLMGGWGGNNLASGGVELLHVHARLWNQPAYKYFTWTDGSFTAWQLWLQKSIMCWTKGWQIFNLCYPENWSVCIIVIFLDHDRDINQFLCMHDAFTSFPTIIGVSSLCIFFFFLSGVWHRVTRVAVSTGQGQRSKCLINDNAWPSPPCKVSDLWPIELHLNSAVCCLSLKLPAGEKSRRRDDGVHSVDAQH